MYKLLIVDDEKEIREGLAAWPWETLGLESAGSCAHGLEALQFIAETPVDIVLTDIRMPFMDGVALMEALSRDYPFIHVIILSGYNDFDYTKKAIQHGASDYLLKPVQHEALTSTFAQLVLKLNERKQTEHRLRVLQRKEQMLAKVLRQDFLRRLFQHYMYPDDLEQGSSEGEVLLEGTSFTVACYRLDRIHLFKRNVSEREMRLLTFALDNILQDIWEARGLGYHLVDRDTAQFMLLSAAEDPLPDFSAVIRQLQRYIGLFKSTISAGIGRTVERPADIYISAQTACETLAATADEASIARYEETFAGERLRAIPQAQGRQDVPLPETGEGGGHDGLLLKKAKQYIRENYNRSLTLKEVAEHVHLSQSHLSALFKKKGETYLKYLTSIRMQKAMELLADPAMKVYEVVERVGYSDPAYFSELFKKYTGQSPHKYRGS